MKSIIELCRELPDSEPEIRERAEEFNALVAGGIGWRIHRRNTNHWTDAGREDSSDYVVRGYIAGNGRFDPLNSIADAKAATDAMAVRAVVFLITVYTDLSAICEVQIWADDEIADVLDTEASTEELARSAAALLAADAMARI